MSGKEKIGLDALLTGLRGIADETRLRLLALLSISDLNVKDLTQILGQSQPRISRHLKLLHEAGIIDRYKEGSWAYYRLSDNGSISNVARELSLRIDFSDPIIERDFDRLKQIQKQRADEASQYFQANAPQWDQLRSMHVHESEVEQAIIKAMEGKSFQNLLDVGTGTGRILELLSPMVEKGIGVDLSTEMLKYARVNLAEKQIQNCHVRHCDLYHLPFDAGSFDLVIIHQVLHYLEFPDKALLEISRTCRPGANLIVVDFEPHQLEELREKHAHRRLGIAQEQLLSWFDHSGFALESKTIMDGPKALGRHKLDVFVSVAVKQTVLEQTGKLNKGELETVS